MGEVLGVTVMWYDAMRHVSEIQAYVHMLYTGMYGMHTYARTRACTFECMHAHTNMPACIIHRRIWHTSKGVLLGRYTRASGNA